MTMIEKIARAIAKERGIDPDKAIVTYEARGGILLPREQYEWPTLLREARAAVTSMREPSEAMIEVAYGARDHGAWADMIDAILAETK